MKTQSKIMSVLLAAAMLPALPVFADTEGVKTPYVDEVIEAPVGVFEDITSAEEFYVENEYGEVVTALLSKSDFVPGDANLDGKFNNVDVAYTQRYLASWSGYNKTEVALGALDLDGDGKVNAIDAITLNRHLAAWDGYESIVANSFVSEQNTTTFVISATPKQYYAKSYTGEVYNSASDTGVTYVGIQQLRGGLPSGVMLYVPCEDLGIPEADVEDYFNRSVDVINYHARTRTFTDAIVGEEPVIVTHEDVTVNSNTKITIDGVKYTVGNFIEGTELLNEMVMFAGNGYVVTAKMLVTDKDGNIIRGDGNIIACVAYESASGIRYYIDQINGNVFDEFKALNMYGVFVTGKDAPFTFTDTMGADDLKNQAYELALYDDDRDGLYERSVYTPITMGVYYTYLANIGGSEKMCDGLIYDSIGRIATAELVNYTDPAAKENGAVCVYTYNPLLNTVNVIDVLEVQTGELTKVDARGFNSVVSNPANVVKLTLGGEEYTLAYDIEPYTSDKSKWTVNGPVLGAHIYEKNAPGYDLADLGESAFLDIFNTKEELAQFINTSLVGKEFNYIAYNGYIIMISKDQEEVVPDTAFNGGWVLMVLPPADSATVITAEEAGLIGEDYADTYYAYYGNYVGLDNGAKLTAIYSEEMIIKNGSSYRLIEVDENGVAVEADGNSYSWFNVFDTGDAAWNYIQGNRNYALYGIEDMNSNTASAAESNWGKSDNRVNFFDWLYYDKMGIDVDGFEKVPSSIHDVELVDDIINVDTAGGYYVIKNLEDGTDICDAADRITTVKVVDNSSISSVKTGEEALKYLKNAPQICYMDGSYLEDGVIVFLTVTTVSDK